MKILWHLSLILTLTASAFAQGRGAPVVERRSSGGIDWQVNVPHERLALVVSGPSGRFEREIEGSPSLGLFDDQGNLLRDGQYKYELRLVRSLNATARQRLEPLRESGDVATLRRVMDSFGIFADGVIHSGSFQIRNGSLVTGGREASGGLGSNRVFSGSGAPDLITAADQVIPDDLIVQSSLCVGIDCVNNESFGFDTIRLKENNLRIKFEDTSVSSGFPTRDWQLTANDSANGGMDRFSIEDIDAAKIPFTIEGNAPGHSLYVDGSGKIGLRTSAPVLDLHFNTGDTPALRFEQNASQGYPAQIWDVAGNEANFFVRDLSGGSRLPFRIRPGAPTSSIDIQATGNVGLGTASPVAQLHLVRSDDAVGATSAKILIDNTSTVTGNRELFELRNKGGVFFVLKDKGAATYSFANLSNQFVISNQGNPGVELQLGPTGNLSILGTLSQNSSRDSKENVLPVDGKEVLEKILALPITTWSYKNDPARHLGPMAEDFHASFGLGATDKQVAPIDTSGVALASIQGLHALMEAIEARVAQLEARNEELATANADLARRLAALDEVVGRIASSSTVAER